MKIEKLDEVRHIITMQCNLECLHCYLKAGGKDNLHKNKIISEDILDNFYLKYQPNVVSATGGEPLMNIEMVYLLTTLIVVLKVSIAKLNRLSVPLTDTIILDIY